MRLIDADNVLNGIEELKKSPWFNRGKEIVKSDPGFQHIGYLERKEAVEIVRDLCIRQEPTVGGWIPFVKRPLTDDEKNTHPDWCYILEGSVPEDEEEILLYRPWKNSKGYIIMMDQYINNGTECYLDGAGDIENGMFWMPLPEPPKEDKRNEKRAADD